MPRAILLGFVICLAAALPGCHGPLVFPTVVRLDADQQQLVDTEWNNMLTPVNKVDRRAFLDIIMMQQLFQNGVDDLCMRSVKNYAQGRIVMEVNFVRSRPKDDFFRVQIYDKRKHLLRVEKYSGDEILAELKSYQAPATQKFDAHGNAEPLSSLEQTLADEYAARVAAIIAATQPATQPATGPAP